MALDDKKIPPRRKGDEAIAFEVRRRLKDGLLSCAAGFAVAEALGISPAVVGRTADALNIRLTFCQLGLFGFPGHAKGWDQAKAADKPVPAGLEDALRSAHGSKGEVSCLAIWKAAERFGVLRMQVGYLADKLGLRIRPCQLGAF